MRRARRTLCVLASAAVFSAVGAVGANAGVVTTGFDSGAEGWEAAGNGAGSAQWLAADGLPAGHLAISDAALGWAYFAAPVAYRLPIEEGALLSFDLKSSSDAARPIVSPVRVALVGAGLTLVAETVLPTASWERYDFVLGLTGGFRVQTSAASVFDSAARQPTADEWRAVLASLNSLYISADYSAANQPSGGFEINELDNVRLDAIALATVPEPGTLALVGVACVGLIAARGRRHVC